ncbi:MAG TPA: DUF4333 domain-containing protein [Pseudonocardiaceae bacterium]|jgi:hypothetical protein|nr:DUF4333 domain-containing protein [Pseudonocardiaceae bacterium]
MTSPYGPSGRNEPQWGNQPSYGAGPVPQPSGYGQPVTQQVPPYAAPTPPSGFPAPGSQPGYQPEYSDGPAEPRRRTGLIWGAVVVVVVAIAGFVVLGYVWAPWISGSRGFLVSTVFDSSAMDSGVASILRNEYGYSDVQAADVTCPSNKPVTNGETFSCVANIDGSTKNVSIKVTSNDGNYEVFRPQ